VVTTDDLDGIKDEMVENASSAHVRSRDGQSILFMRLGKAHAGVWILPLSGDRQPKPLLQSAVFDQRGASLSPNSRFVAYTSNESGRFEVYVQSFPPAGDKWMTQQLFQARLKSGSDDYPYGVTPDGSRLLIKTPAEANDPAPMVVVLNWTATLKQKQ
jgi:Tol biopolymer transport system component